MKQQFILTFQIDTIRNHKTGKRQQKLQAKMPIRGGQGLRIFQIPATDWVDPGDTWIVEGDLDKSDYVTGPLEFVVVKPLLCLYNVNEEIDLDFELAERLIPPFANNLVCWERSNETVIKYVIADSSPVLPARIGSYVCKPREIKRVVHDQKNQLKVVVVKVDILRESLALPNPKFALAQ